MTSQWVLLPVSQSPHAIRLDLTRLHLLLLNSSIVRYIFCLLRYTVTDCLVCPTVGYSNCELSIINRIICGIVISKVEAQWIRLRLPSCHPRFESKAKQSTLSSFNFKCVLYLSCEKNKNKQKRSGLTHLKRSFKTRHQEPYKPIYSSRSIEDRAKLFFLLWTMASVRFKW